MLGNYDASIPVRAAKIRSLQSTLEGLPSQKETAAAAAKPAPDGPNYVTKKGDITPKQYSEPNANKPIPRPELNTQQMREEIIRKTAARWRETSQYQIRRLAVSGISSAIGAVFGHGGYEGAAVGYLGAEFVPKAVAALIEKTRVMAWLAKDEPADIEALNTIPNIDKMKIITTLTDTAIQQAKAGKPVKLAPGVATFLGAANVAKINAALPPQNAGDAKRRVAALQAR